MTTFTKKSLKSTSQITILNLNEALRISGNGHQVDLDKTNRTYSTSESSSFEASLSKSKSNFGRSVSFSESIEDAAPHLHRSEYTIPERRSTWYDQMEVRSLKSKRTRLIKRLEQGDDSVSECTRGLESRTKEGMRLRALNIMNAVSTVLNTQEEELQEDETVAQAYSRLTHQSQIEALERAAKDQEEASLLAISTTC